MNFRENLSCYVIGEARTSQLPGIAIDALGEGLDSPSLRMLAGLSGETNAFQLEAYLKDALRELGIKMPDLRTAALIYGMALAREVINGQTPVLEGLARIRTQVLRKYDFFAESGAYAYDSIGFERLYGLYFLLDELPQQYHYLQTDKSLAELQMELESRIISELRGWRPMEIGGA